MLVKSLHVKIDSNDSVVVSDGFIGFRCAFAVGFSLAFVEVEQLTKV